MPRYMFSIQKDDHPAETLTAEFPDADAAKAEAVQRLGGEMRNAPRTLVADQDWHVQVMDESGLVLFTVYSTTVESAALLR